MARAWIKGGDYRHRRRADSIPTARPSTTYTGSATSPTSRRSPGRTTEPASPIQRGSSRRGRARDPECRLHRGRQSRAVPRHIPRRRRDLHPRGRRLQRRWEASVRHVPPVTVNEKDSDRIYAIRMDTPADLDPHSQERRQRDRITRRAMADVFGWRSLDAHSQDLACSGGSRFLRGFIWDWAAKH